MFCFQCQQTAGGKGCVQVGVCGKQPETAGLQDDLVRELIALAEAAEDVGQHPAEATRLLEDGLFTTLTNVNFDNAAIQSFTDRVVQTRRELSLKEFPVIALWNGETDTVSLRSTLLFGLKGMAAYAHHARNLCHEDEAVSAWFYKGLCAVNREHTVEEWLALILEFGQVNFRCMELLDAANTGAFGDPTPTRVTTDIKKGPFIVVSGHDLEDLHQLLEQTSGTGVNVYTHSEMLPAHGYPGLNKYPQLAGNFGTAWQNQQKEFENLPAPVLFTTNCLMPPRPSYADRVYTTSVVGYEGMMHITADSQGHKDFSPLIRQAKALGGYEHDHSMSGINGGHMLTTGFAHAAVLAHAPALIDAIKAPEKSGRGDDKLTGLAAGGQQKRSEQRQKQRGGLDFRGKAPDTGAGDKQNKNQAQSLQNRCGGGVGIGNTHDIGGLAGHEAENTVGRQTRYVPVVLPDVPAGSGVAQQGQNRQNNGGEKQPRTGKPQRRHMKIGEKILSAGAGKAPENTADHGAERAPQRGRDGLLRRNHPYQVEKSRKHYNRGGCACQ